MSEEINTLGQLMRAVQDSKTGGYECDLTVKPNMERSVASGTREEGNRTFFLVIVVDDSEPDREGGSINGEWWFWDDDTVMQVL